MHSNKPYLFRAMYQWIVDNGVTPYVIVSVDYPGIAVPLEYAQDGKIVLNISPGACREMHMDNDHILFTARFGGIARNITIPMGAVLAIYAKENGRGMEFSIEQPVEKAPVLAATADPKTSAAPKPARGRPKLSLVKNDSTPKEE